MKIIITEGQINNVIEDILSSQGITYELQYKGKSYGSFDANKMYDHVSFIFHYPNGDEYERNVSFVTKEDGILRFSGCSIFSDAISDLKYLPNDVVNNYFANIAEKFLEDLFRYRPLY